MRVWLAGVPGAQLQAVLFFLQKLNRHHAILLQPAIELTAIDTKGRSSLDLITAKLLQDRQDVALLDLRQRHAVVHVSLKHLPEVAGVVCLAAGKFQRQIVNTQIFLGADRQRILNCVLQFPATDIR